MEHVKKMEHAKKMVVVPQELFARMSDTTKSTTHEGSSLDDEMRSILNNTKFDDRKKWSLYEQVLRRSLYNAALNRQPFSIPVVENEPVVNGSNSSSGTVIDDEIVESLPTVYRHDTRSLLRVLRRRPDLVRWDNEGTVYTHERKIPDSNIVDIVHAIVRARKTVHLPPGWEQVMDVLKDMNVPVSYVGNPAALEFLGHEQPETPTRSRRSLFMMPETPEHTPSHERLIKVPYSNRRPHWSTSPYRKRKATTSSPSGWEPF